MYTEIELKKHVRDGVPLNNVIKFENKTINFNLILRFDLVYKKIYNCKTLTSFKSE